VNCNNEDITIDESQMSVWIQLLMTFGRGNICEACTRFHKTSSVVSEIINASIANRVLCTYHGIPRA
jgi:hypothetical protein